MLKLILNLFGMLFIMYLIHPQFELYFIQLTKYGWPNKNSQQVDTINHGPVTQQHWEKCRLNCNFQHRCRQKVASISDRIGR